MSVTYPITLPSTPSAPAQFAIELVNMVAKTESIFTFKQSVFRYPGSKWQVSVALPVMTRTDAAPWRAALASLNGPFGTFMLTLPGQATPLGSGAGTPVVDGAGQQNSLTVATRGWTPSANGVLLAGDFFQINNHFYQVVGDVNADANGEAVINVVPRIRDALVDGATITLNNPKCIFRLLGNTSWNVQPKSLYAISFDAEEAL